MNLRVSAYAPTVSYVVGRLANTGKNFWTIGPTLAFMYFGTRNGLEFSVFTGQDFNTENEDTSYTSGTQIHEEGTLAGVWKDPDFDASQRAFSCARVLSIPTPAPEHLRRDPGRPAPADGRPGNVPGAVLVVADPVHAVAGDSTMEAGE